jgi:hypothetical protein
MADYAGAVAAIKALLVSNWVTGGQPTSLIVYANTQPEPPFPPINPKTNNPAAFLVCEVSGTKGDPHTFGNAGNRFFLYSGLIVLHALVPINDGTANAEQLAVNAAEIFRTATFYVDANGSFIRTTAPNPPDGGSGADLEGLQAGSYFRVSCTVPFFYYHRA